jgi:hypothetical protein
VVLLACAGGAATPTTTPSISQEKGERHGVEDPGVASRHAAARLGRAPPPGVTMPKMPRMLEYK